MQLTCCFTMKENKLTRTSYSTGYIEGQRKNQQWDHKRLGSASAVAWMTLDWSIQCQGTQYPLANE